VSESVGESKEIIRRNCASCNRQRKMDENDFECAKNLLKRKIFVSE
jgi:hypothetical protein